MKSLLARLVLAFGIVIPVSGSIAVEKPSSADWCQCVIFVLNRMGIEQIPGEYWTASSLAVADENGKTWMEYQGYSEREAPDLPQPGDLLILSNGAEVITRQTWGGEEHLVPVAVDGWAGHIGIVEGAEYEKFDETSYLQIQLLSANWGVNAKPSGVVGSCYNVDESIFLVPERYKKAHFFHPTDPWKVRERIVNRAQRWAALGVAYNPQTTLDGFPVTPLGFVNAALLEPGTNPLKPKLLNPYDDLVEISVAAVMPGDLIVIEKPGEAEFYGIVAGISTEKNFSRGKKTFELISMGVEVGGGFPRHTNMDIENSASFARFYRMKSFPGYPDIDENSISWVQNGKNLVNVNLTLNNAGGNTIVVENIHIQANRVVNGDLSVLKPIRSGEASNIRLLAGETYYFSETLEITSRDSYDAEIHIRWNDNLVIIPNAATIELK